MKRVAIITKKLLPFYFLILISPLSAWSFSETELDSLESSGTKKLSQSPWRTQVGFRLQRNTLLNSSYTDHTGQDHISPLDPDEKYSLLDPSSLYYGISLTVSHSLSDIIQGKQIQTGKYSFLKWLKNTELFLSGSFSTPVSGYRNHYKNYNALKYLHYAVGDISLGLITPVYSKDNFFSDISFFLTPFPLSGFSQEAGFQASFGGGISLLYFLKKETTWSFALSLSQRSSFREYKKETVDIGGLVVNTPFSAIQGGSLIYRQNHHNKYIPSNVRISANYYFGVDFEKVRNHDLGLAVSSSWKIRNRTYLSCSLSWKDRVSVHSPQDPDIRLVNPVNWFSKNKTVFSIGGSYSF